MEIKSLLIEDTTKEERIRIVQEGLNQCGGACDFCNGCDTNGEIPSAKLLEEIEGIQKEEKLDEKTEFAKGIKILVAEDHPVNREILVQFLKKFGATIFQAENGIQAINTISKNPEIQMIFMDIQKADQRTDGRQALEADVHHAGSLTIKLCQRDEKNRDCQTDGCQK